MIEEFMKVPLKYRCPLMRDVVKAETTVHIRMEFVQTWGLSGRFISFPTTLTFIVPVCDWGDDL